MSEIRTRTKDIRARFGLALAGTSSSEAVERLRVEYLGKKGHLTTLLRGMGGLPPEERPLAGEAVNELKAEIERALADRLSSLIVAEEEAAEIAERIDVSLRGAGRRPGVPHPVAQTMREAIEIFVGMGFSVTSGPEAELDFFNFEALNFKPHHPARDMQDTFYLEGGRLLRTHTSPVEVRSMQDRGAPLRIICPGRVYRRDSDPTHSPMFHQLEGLLIDEDVSVADLKGCLDAFVNAIFGRPLKTRYRASYFPFTEPSLEVDVECVACGGSGEGGCRVCKGTGWLEILGSGMTHPNVLRAGGIDPDRYNGFAWGMGIDRVAMLKYGLTDLRPLFEGDLIYLEGRE